jgi:hypothetical protein
MSQHTPGPWKVEEIDKKLFVTASNEDFEFCICRVFELGQTDNADLIAAAPELLQELKNMVEHWQFVEDSDTNELFDAARAAIAKAEGESK